MGLKIIQSQFFKKIVLRLIYVLLVVAVIYGLYQYLESTFIEVLNKAGISKED